MAALGIAVVSAIAAIALAETVVGGIAAPVAAVGALATFVTKSILAKDKFETDAGQAHSKWEKSLTDWTDFDGERWPRAVFPS